MGRLRRWTALGAVLAATFAVAGPSAAQEPTLTGPAAGSTVGIPGPFEGPFGTFEGPFFPLGFGCSPPWTLYVDPDVAPGPVGGQTSDIDQQFNPNWRDLLLIRGARVDLPATRTLNARLVCHVNESRPEEVELLFSTSVTYAEGPEGVTPPPDRSPTPEPGTDPAPSATPCPGAAEQLALARYWNALAQDYRARSIAANQAVIDAANRGFAAFMAFFDGFATDSSSDKVAGKAEEKLLDLEWEAIKREWLGEDADAGRQVKRLRDLRRYFRALGPIGELEGGLHIGEGLYYLGVAAQQGLLRDTWDDMADDALANAERHRLAACGSPPGSRALIATIAAAADGPFTELAVPQAIKSVRIRSGPGLSARTARRLDALVRGQERTVALARVIADAVDRARRAGEAGDAASEARQLEHVRATAAALADHLGEHLGAREAFAAALRGAARKAARVEIRRPARLAKALRRLGLPAALRRALRRAGLDAAPFEDLLAAVPARRLMVPPLAGAVREGVVRDRTWAAELRALAAGP